MQHLSRIIIPPVVVLLLAFAYHYYRDYASTERAMMKELEYVIEQQSQEIETLKKQLEENAKLAGEKSTSREAIKSVEKSYKVCPDPIGMNDLPCVATGPTASITVRGYRDSIPESQR